MMKTRTTWKGYRVGDIPLPKLNPVKPGFKISKFRQIGDPPRVDVDVSLGPHYDGAACPVPGSDAHTSIIGACHRAGRKPPTADRCKIKKLGAFVQEWLEKNLTPLPHDTDVSFDTWIDKTPYTWARKQELKSRWVLDVFEDPKNLHCKSFIKYENYPEFKHARGINSRSDPFKCAIGPFFKVIEEVVFRNPWFIKKIPIADRPAYINERLYMEGAVYLTSDYTSFEALFTAELMKEVEIRLYKYMTQFLPDRDYFWRMLDEVLTSTNICHYKSFDVIIEATRMSGEMCTSLGNGFSNLMFILFLCSEIGTEVTGVVEGDDGLFRIDGKAPTTSDFEELGLRVKLEEHEDLSTASFCGLIFDPIDQINITCPLQELVTFGHGTAKYAGARDSKLKSLLKCKSLSMLYQYSGCPIIQEMAVYGLRNTRQIDHRTHMNSKHVSLWEREQLLDADSALRRAALKVREIPLQTRLLMERVFKVTVEQQLIVEEYFRNKNDLLPIHIPAIDELLPMCWRQYDEMYSGGLGKPHYCDALQPDLEKQKEWEEILVLSK